MDWVNPREISARIAGVPAETRTESRQLPLSQPRNSADDYSDVIASGNTSEDKSETLAAAFSCVAAGAHSGKAAAEIASG
jgi:hypothetical protein